MRYSRHIFSGVEFLLVLFLFLAGLLFFGLSHLIEVRENLALWLLRYPQEGQGNFSWVGLVLIVLAVILGLGFFLLERKGSLRLVMQRWRAEVDEEVLRKGIAQFFREEHLQCFEFVDAFIARNQIEIILSTRTFAKIAKQIKNSKQRKELYIIEKKLGDFLHKQFEYDSDFFLYLN